MNFSFCLMLCVWMLELSWNILLKYTGNKPWVTEYIKLLIRSLLWFSTLELLWPLYFWLVFSSSIYLLSSSLYFLAYSQPSQTGCPPYFHTWCGLSANVECISEMCCTRLAGNTWRKKSPFWHHRTNLSGYIFATKAYIDNQKKPVKQQHLLHMSW